MRVLQVHTRTENVLEELEEVVGYFDMLYLLGVWTISDYSKVFNSNYKQDGSLFSIEDYTPEVILDPYLKYNKPIIVDYIPNHIGITSENLKKYRVDGQLVYGNNQWMDVLQIQYCKSEVVKNMLEDLKTIIATLPVTGFRFDMANLIPTNILGFFIDEMRKIKPDLIFIAEAYDNYDDLIKCGFDYVYRLEPRRRQDIENKETNLVVVDNHDEPFLANSKSLDLLEKLNKYDNTLMYLPSIMGYQNRPSANYYKNRDWNINENIKKQYLEILKKMEG